MSMALAERHLSYDQVQALGLVGARIRLSLNKLLRDRELHTRYADWGADQIGRWIGATSALAQVVRMADSQVDGAKTREIIREKVNELIAAQDEEGLFYGDKLGETPDRWREIWFGQGRGIWNLLDFYHFTGDKETFDALIKAADCAVAKRDAWAISDPLCGGIESVVGAMAILGRELGRDDYATYARSFADQINRRVGPPVCAARAHVDPASLPPYVDRDDGHHSHSYLSTAHGIVDLFVTTGDQRYLVQAKKVYADTLSSVWASGGIPESYCDLYERCDETCSAVDWMMLALKLYAVTGEVRYLDAVELSLLNHMLFSQMNHGGFSTYRCLNRRDWMNESNWGFEQPQCCSMSGGWGLAQAVTYAVTTNDRGLSINLPVAIAAEIPGRGGSIRVSQNVRMAERNILQRVQVRNGTDAALEVKLRIPYWCDAPVLRVGGDPQPLVLVKGWATVTCGAGADQEIELRLPMKLAVIPARSSPLTRNGAGASGEAYEEALQYGPFVLMFYREMYPEITQRDIALTIRRNGEGLLPVEYREAPQGWMEGAIPLFVTAQIEDGSEVLLTPCANATMYPFSVPDPTVLRFSKVTIVSPR